MLVNTSASLTARSYIAEASVQHDMTMSTSYSDLQGDSPARKLRTCRVRHESCMQAAPAGLQGQRHLLSNLQVRMTAAACSHQTTFSCNFTFALNVTS